MRACLGAGSRGIGAGGFPAGLSVDSAMRNENNQQGGTMTVKYLPNDAKVERGPLLWWQKRGLMYTATGYGGKIPTEYRVRWNSRHYRVYAACHSNCASLYVISHGRRYYIHDWMFPEK